MTPDQMVHMVKVSFSLYESPIGSLLFDIMKGEPVKFGILLEGDLHHLK